MNDQNLKKIVFFHKISEIFFSLFFNVYNENMFTFEIEDGREAPLKPSWLEV